MSGPRYIAKLQLTFVAGTCLRAWRVYDLHARQFTGPEYKRKAPVIRSVDRRNAAILKQSDAYRKAKDNG